MQPLTPRKSPSGNLPYLLPMTWLCSRQTVLVPWKLAVMSQRHGYAVYQSSGLFPKQKCRISSALCVLRGISSVASVILHLAFPDHFPMLGFRALASLGYRQPRSYTLQFWLDYCKAVKGIAAELGLSLRTVDKTLWRYSKENNEPPTCKAILSNSLRLLPLDFEYRAKGNNLPAASALGRKV